MVAELERNMRMLEPVIKFITVKLEEDVNPESRVVREGDISFVAQYEDEPEREVAAEADSSFDEDDDNLDSDSDDESEPSARKDLAPDAEDVAEDETDEDETDKDEE
jgi:hypothetical protein